jgi:hypothetical protein
VIAHYCVADHRRWEFCHKRIECGVYHAKDDLLIQFPGTESRSHLQEFEPHACRYEAPEGVQEVS